MSHRRVILHVDMDAFFASIEQLDRPELRGWPVLVGSDQRRGVVAAASYEARPFGCHSAQPMAVALRQCPHAQVVRPRGRRYKELSQRLFAIFEDLTPLVEPLSIDEAFLDVTGTERLHGEPVELARRLKQRIREELQLTGSVGIAPNKFLAKLASDQDKPDGLTVVEPGRALEWLAPLPIDRLWGVGPRTAERMKREGIHTLGDLRQRSEDTLRRRFGSAGTSFYRLARGIDERPITPDHQAKSIGHERTFAEDLQRPEDVRRVLLDQTEQVARRLRRQGLAARGVSLKIRFGDFETIGRSASLDRPADSTAELWRAARRLFDQWAAERFRPVRLIGVQATGLGEGGQMALFDDPAAQQQRKVDQAADAIVERFGEDAIRRGGTL